jgi:hypothetical protein
LNDLKSRKVFVFSILFNAFGSSKTIDFPIVFSSIFHYYFFFKKAPFGPPFSLKKLPFVFPPYYQERPFRDPAFHETTVILVPLGPSVFLKDHFFDADWLLFHFFCFSLCYVLYVIFITFVEKAR